MQTYSIVTTVMQHASAAVGIDLEAFTDFRVRR